MLDTSIQVKTDYFDGPLGLLLLLIQKEEMDIRELELTKITKQYLDYLAQMRELNFDIAGDYLYLAATLLLLKSKNCITEEESKKMIDQLGLMNRLILLLNLNWLEGLRSYKSFKESVKTYGSFLKRGTKFLLSQKLKRLTILTL